MKIKFVGSTGQLLQKLHKISTDVILLQESPDIVRVRLLNATLTWWPMTGTLVFQGIQEQFYKELWLKNDSTVSLSLLEMTSDVPIHEMEEQEEIFHTEPEVTVKHVCGHYFVWVIEPTDADKMIRCPKCLELAKLEDRIQWHKREIDELELKVTANKLGVIHGEIVSRGNDLYLIDVNKNDVSCLWLSGQPK